MLSRPSLAPYSFDLLRTMLFAECVVSMGVDLFQLSSQPYPAAAHIKDMPDDLHMHMAGHTISGTVMFWVWLVLLSSSACKAKPDTTRTRNDP